MKKRKSHNPWFFAACALIILLAFWIRWSGINWQLPDTPNGDEEALVQMSESIPYIGGKLGFWYGPAYNYLSGIVFEIFDWSVVQLGIFPSRDLIPVWTHYYVGRALSILMSVSTIVVLLLLFKGIFGELTALFAGRFCVANEHALANTGLDNLCEPAHTPDEYITLINHLMNAEFTGEAINQRRIGLKGSYSNSLNAVRLMQYIW